MNKLVIGLSGWKGSGKDMVADFLVKEYNFTRLSFADPLKVLASQEYNIPLESFYDRDLKEAPLLHLPVKITDSFIGGVIELLKDEFRTASGQKPQVITYQGEGMVNGQYEEVYWTPRALAIFKGSGNRAVDGDFWIKKAMDFIKDGKGDYFVIPDLRFVTEAETLKKTFGDDFVSVRIDRFHDVDSKDPSERDLDAYPFDFKINNALGQMSVIQVYAQVHQLIRNLLGEVSST